MIKENRTLNEYTKAKLDMTSKEFSEAVGSPYRTVADAWHSEKGRENIRNKVFSTWMERRYPKRYPDAIKRFDEL